MSAMLTADWCPLGRDKYYRKFEIYTMDWHHEINLDNVLLAAAPYGGPVAVVRDRKKIVKVQGSTKPIISIYTAAGKLISSIMWNSGPIVAMGWSSTEDLLCVQDDGSVLKYDIFGTYQHTFSMGQEAKDAKILEARIFASESGTGVAVLTSSYRIFLVNSVLEPKVYRLPEIPGPNKSPSSWQIVVKDRESRVLVAKGRDLFILIRSELQAKPVMLDMTDGNSSVVEIAVSQNNRHVALITDDGKLWLGSSDLRDKYMEKDTEFPCKPRQLVWCGTEAVIGYWESVLLLAGRQGDFTKYGYDSGVYLVPEMDGVRVLSLFSHEMIQKVPNVVQEIFRINSNDPGSYLFEASKQFQKGSHRADEYIRIVKDKLEEAVKNCIEAAGYEFDTDTQKMLIRAAQFGKGFVPSMNSDSYVRMCRLLRVLNAVRNRHVGIPLTITQLEHLTTQVLLDRLVLRHHYCLAIHIAKYLRLPETEGSSRILAHWACYKVKQTQLDREQVAREIAEKLGDTPGVSYSDIAIKAADCGRTQLAIKLMDYEPRANLQVPLLLRLGEVKPALVKAIESGDTDLVFTVLLHLRENMPLGEFQLAVRNFPMAQALYIKYCRDHNPETLRDIYVQEDDFNAQAACFIRESYDLKNQSRDASLEAAQDAYRRARNDFGASLCEEQLRLSRYQRQLEEKMGTKFAGASLRDTVYRLLMLSEVKLADKLRTEYKVSDRTYCWLRILSLAELGNWTELEKLSKVKKSPAGHEPFVEVCLKHNNIHEAQKYLPKVRDELKVKYYVKAKLFEEASRIAFEQKDVQGLLYIQNHCQTSDRTLSDKINVLVSQLANKK
ncbi:vacuolar protein sorting-associated protein 16 homolog [Schistocerca gregaria]|uniref:vacuolar protein sorting-associated protein 16 homolog n=1 Tax=Schistocerca gregaria TaxID=7010 RepID=UPI00211EAEC1|nr:vacuolar protein sorting-associated protein 16 homolog [Schistocerca gregaria]